MVRSTCGTGTILGARDTVGVGELVEGGGDDMWGEGGFSKLVSIGVGTSIDSTQGLLVVSSPAL